MTTEEIKHLRAVQAEMLDALYAALNVEGPAMVGGRTTHKELDVRWHFDKIRAAIAKAAGSAS